MSDIDSIFKEMKAESSSMKCVNLENLNRPKKKKVNSKKSKSLSLGIESLSVSLPGDSSRAREPHPSASKVILDPNVDPESTVESMAEGIMDMVQEGGSSSMTAMGDSDDESGDDAAVDENVAERSRDKGSVPALPPPPPPSSTRRWTIDRFNSALSSQELKIRTDALRALYHVVSHLAKSLPSLPELDLPPPYDPSRIVLTHKQGAMVSDMASGQHAPHWAAWQKTHSSLMSQFLEDKTAAPLKPNVPPSTDDDEDGDEASDSITPLTSSVTLAQENEVRKKMQFVLDGTANSLFKRVSDTSEKCRELSLKIVKILIQNVLDLTKHVSYLLPALLSRYPPTFFDQELNVFIHDLEAHEGYKRGVASERQDKSNLVHGIKKIDVVEPSEEVRLLLCDVVGSLLKAGVSYGSLSILNPYFSDLILILQSQLRDPYPVLKCRASMILIQMVRIPQWEGGAMVFATAISRACIQNLRHRNAKVRLASLSLFEAAVGVPNRAKVRGAGTDAIADVVGFREENVLPIAAFYDSSCGVSVNALAEVCQDKNSIVRARCCAVLCFFITCLPDRYDHHTRLLPYVLSFFNDDIKETRAMAIQAIEHCGGQYEAEHPDDIIERRQYGVDGDSRTNVDAPLPVPFEKRPRLGARLFVRGNTKRFFKALLRELTNWIDVTRDRSADLIVSLVVYCEEHLTMDFHDTLPKVVKALDSSIKEGKVGEELRYKFELVLELMGRFVDPDTYVPLLLPRIVGDDESATSMSEGGVHTVDSRRVHAKALECLMRGSLTRQLTPHVKKIIIGFCEDSDCLSGEVSVDARLLFCQCLNSLLVRIRGGDGKILTGYFNATGRLADLDPLWMAVCKGLLSMQNNVEGNLALKKEAEVGLRLFKKGEGGTEGGSMNTNSKTLGSWAPKIQQKALEEIIEEGHAMWERGGKDVRVVENLWRNEEAAEGMLNGVVDLVMYGGWIAEGLRGEDFESEDVGVECLGDWATLMVAAVARFLGGTKEERGVVLADSLEMLLGEIMFGEGGRYWGGESLASSRASLVRAACEAMSKAGKEEKGIWKVGLQFAEDLLKGAGGDFKAVGAVLDFLCACRKEGGAVRLKSFRKGWKGVEGVGGIRDIWKKLVVGKTGGYWDLGIKDRSSWGRMCGSLVYFLVGGEEGEGGGEEEETKVKKGAKKVQVKLQRVQIEFSDDSESDDEDEDMKRIAEEVGQQMAGDFKKIEVTEDDDEDDEEGGEDGFMRVQLGAKKVNATMKGGETVTLKEFVEALLPIGGTEKMKMGMDGMEEEEFDAAALYDGALRLAAVLDPKVVIKAAEKEKERVNCNFYNGIMEHAELLMKLGG